MNSRSPLNSQLLKTSIKNIEKTPARISLIGLLQIQLVTLSIRKISGQVEPLIFWTPPLPNRFIRRAIISRGHPKNFCLAKKANECARTVTLPCRDGAKYERRS